MKCKSLLLTMANILLVSLLVGLSLSCKETLPEYVAPQNVLSLNITTIEPLNDHVAPPYKQKIHFVIVGENVHDEVFLDSVEIKGSMRIWWKRKPQRFRTIYLTENNLTDRNMVHNKRMMLLPGQRFSMDVYWDLRSDGGIYLPYEMDYLWARRRYCGNNVICATPEDFVVEVSLNVYNRLGYIVASPKEFIFIAKACVCNAFPPCGNGGGEC